MPNNLINVILLVFIVIIMIIWLILTIRTIKFEKRIENHVVISNKDKDISLMGKLLSWYCQLNKKIVVCLKFLKIDKSIKEVYEVQEELSFVADRVLFSLFGFFVYLIISLLATNFKVLLACLFLLLGSFVPVIKKKIENIYVKKKIENDLLKAISLMNNAFGAGKSIVQAIGVVKEELDGPICKEFEKIENDLVHGLSLNVAFERFKARVNIDEVDYVATSLVILNQTGGNIASVFTSIEESFYTRRRLDSELKAIVSSSKLVFQILVVLPFFLYFMIGLWNPNYFTIFFESHFGIILFLVIVGLYLLYIFVIRSIMKVEKY